MGFRTSRFWFPAIPLSCHPNYRALTFALAGLSPAEHTSLSWLQPPHQLISGRDRIPYQGPSCIVARAQGSKGMGPICYAAYCSPAKTRSHIHLGNGTIVLSSLRRFYLLLRTAPSGTTPVSR